mmetsp:Transcript_20269/g.24214  ORF Transcript_20269/g.24214 Transcript_20269/m.24214 type:complete len:325 (+) Transcript_20269:106-1080(+)|eukprot:CAMPEP_0197854570 /NCGR_PEP_ID=MMETSP1438-20131217/24912_1 /TAXON_ID=1461541 /ORGANISM="Pterosperma sp., Strain CCMP1384" /LENGTH=324 /DNA_ID=CAMNT_0043469349 /DNA_START=95 /DNA_END=1069 /DNA_ORIENTATION=+
MASPLSDEHEMQVQTFLYFSAQKRKLHLKEVASTVSDVKDYELDEPVYNKDDVTGLLDKLQDNLDNTVEKELAHASHTSGLLLRLLFLQAEASGLELEVDTNALENEALIAKIKDSEKSALEKTPSDFVKKANRLKKVTGGGTDPRIVAERDSLKEELQVMKDKFQKLQLSTTTVLKEKTAMGEKITALQDGMNEKEKSYAQQLEEREEAVRKKEAEVDRLQMDLEERERSAKKASASSSEAMASVSSDVAELKKKMQGLEEELRVKTLEVQKCEEQITTKLNDSKQFQTMKKMMQTKSTQITELRKRLAMYEPPDENIADADA